jgi:uncharacterized protein (TIGR00106 family)
MKLIIDWWLSSIGPSVSVSKFVAAGKKFPVEARLDFSLHANGTNFDRNWNEVFPIVKRCYGILHTMRVPCIFSWLQVTTWIDQGPMMQDKIDSVTAKLAGH